MLKRVFGYFKRISANQQKFLQKLEFQSNQLKELEWAQIYHDSIRGDTDIENLPLNIGRWAGNYSFFYVLNRIMNHFKPQSILEFGLGESTKFISTFIDSHLSSSRHTIIEHDIDWITHFNNGYNLSQNSKVFHHSLKQTVENSNKILYYENIDLYFKNNYDFILIDGPFGSDRFSRGDIIPYIEKFSIDTNYVILLDDTNRIGEADTLNRIINLLNQMKVPVFSSSYEGNKGCSVLSNDRIVTSF